GDDGGETGEHGEGVMVDVAALQLDGASGHIHDSSCDAVGSVPVEYGTIVAFPEQAAKPKSRAHENHVVEFVEIPFVKKKLIERPGALRQAPRNRRRQNVKQHRDQK